MNTDYFSLAVRDLRRTFQPVVTSPPRDPDEEPRPCCAEYAHVVECKADASIWRCPVCDRLWSVPNR